MRRLAATLRWDVLRQYRSGFYAVTAFLVPLSVVLLRWAGGALAAEVVPPLIVVLLLITTFYFAGAILLLEKGEGVLSGLVVTPLRAGEYLLARVGSLALLAIGESLIIVLAGLGMIVNPIALLPGMLMLCGVYALLGTTVITRYDTINEYLMPSALYITLLMLPLLHYTGIWRTPLFYLHPIQPAIELMRAAVEPVGVAMVAYGVLAGGAWLGVSYHLARRSFERFVVRSAGA
jgi:fluoroquinolone transport system permease protein